MSLSPISSYSPSSGFTGPDPSYQAPYQQSYYNPPGPYRHVAMPPASYPGYEDAYISRPYGIQNYGVQQYLPINMKRPLFPEEVAEIRQEQTKWYPKLFPSYMTPIPKMMADPMKKSLISAGFGVIGGLLAGMFIAPAFTGTALLSTGGILGLILAVVFGVGNGIIGYFTQRQRNENLMELMSRLPLGATKRDLDADPVRQADLNRASSHSGDLGSTLLTLGMLNAMTNSRRSRN